MRGILEANLAMKATILSGEVENIGEEWCEKAVCKVLGSIVRASIYTQRQRVLFVKNATELLSNKVEPTQGHGLIFNACGVRGA